MSEVRGHVYITGVTVDVVMSDCVLPDRNTSRNLRMNARLYPSHMRLVCKRHS
jgi:hypothetical protein